jgi:hypothetical protein
MLKRAIPALLLLLTVAAPMASAQTPRTPDECFGFSFGKWEPALRSAASTYSPGYDPTSSAPAGAPRSWATRAPNGSPSTAGEPADSVLLLFPPWWPAGVAIQWTTRHGDTLVGLARALVADGRVKNPESPVRALRVTCGAAPAARAAPRDSSLRGS